LSLSVRLRFKTRESYGNLRLTFFRKEGALEFLVDADLDDAQGIEHIFQALGHAYAQCRKQIGRLPDPEQSAP